MTRHLKLLALLTAMLVLPAIGAAPASAVFHSEAEPTYITANNTGEGNHVFKAGSAEVVCTKASFGAELAIKTSNGLSLFPTYSGCTFLGEAATVDHNGCRYDIGTGPDVVWCPGFSLAITTSACTISLGSQIGEGSAKYTNSGSGSSRDITISFSTKLKFTKSGPLCFLISGETATYTGSITAKGYSNFSHTSQVGIWHS